LFQSKETGVVIVDEEKYNGCAWCFEDCNFGFIQLHPESKVAFVCDLCDGEPKCVEWCPEEALDFVTKEVLAQKARISTVKKLFQKAMISTS
jgi:Fe-S-cluster-containing hydrogenase component 2